MKKWGIILTTTILSFQCCFSPALAKSSFGEKLVDALIDVGKETLKELAIEYIKDVSKSYANKQKVNSYTQSVLSNSAFDNSGSTEIRGIVSGWKSAWEHSVRTNDLEWYKSYYHPSFYSKYTGMTYHSWMSDKSRKARLKNRINIHIGDISWKRIASDQVVVVFDQYYKSDTYIDRGLKYLYLVRVGGNWRILREEQPKFFVYCLGSC